MSVYQYEAKDSTKAVSIIVKDYIKQLCKGSCYTFKKTKKHSTVYVACQGICGDDADLFVSRKRRRERLRGHIQKKTLEWDS